MTNDFIQRLRELHEKAKKGTLTPADRELYTQRREELGRMMLVAQNMGHGGKTLRSHLRIAQVIKVEIETGEEKPYRTVTIDLASGGFAVLMAAPQPVGRVRRFTMKLPAVGGAGGEPISGTGKVASSRPQNGLHRVSFHFQEMAERDRDRLDVMLVDYVLARFA